MESQLQEEKTVLLDCMEINANNNYPYDLTSFWERVGEINEIQRTKKTSNQEGLFT